MNAEKTSELFTQMPNPHYMEIANILLNWFDFFAPFAVVIFFKINFIN
jgi:hypothetical protein